MSTPEASKSSQGITREELETSDSQRGPGRPSTSNETGRKLARDGAVLQALTGAASNQDLQQWAARCGSNLGASQINRTRAKAGVHGPIVIAANVQALRLAVARCVEVGDIEASIDDLNRETLWRAIPAPVVLKAFPHSTKHRNAKLRKALELLVALSKQEPGAEYPVRAEGQQRLAAILDAALVWMSRRSKRMEGVDPTMYTTCAYESHAEEVGLQGTVVVLMTFPDGHGNAPYVLGHQLPEGLNPQGDGLPSMRSVDGLYDRESRFVARINGLVLPPKRDKE